MYSKISVMRYKVRIGFIFATFMFLCLNGYLNICFASEFNAEDVSSFFCKKNLENNVLCTEIVKTYPEVEIKDITDSNNTIYTKKIEMTKTFENKTKYGNLKKVAECFCKIIFTYDKHNFVKINDAVKDINVIRNGDKWSVMSLTEVFPQRKSCLVSSAFVLHKENIMGIKEQKSNTHFDVFCTYDGNLCINTNIR